MGASSGVMLSASNDDEFLPVVVQVLPMVVEALPAAVKALPVAMEAFPMSVNASHASRMFPLLFFLGGKEAYWKVQNERKAYL